MKRKPAQIEIRPNAYVLYYGRATGYELYVAGEYRGGFDSVKEATEYADWFIGEQLRRTA